MLLFSCLFYSVMAGAQQNLSGSRQTSYYTYIYKITTGEVLTLYRSEMNKVSEKYLHSLTDSFRTMEDDEPVLAPGNYLYMLAKDNQLDFTLKSVGDVHYKPVNNGRDLVVALHTKAGQFINDAAVYINRRKIPYDEKTKTYRLNRRTRSGTIKVYHNNVVYFFPLEVTSRRYYTWRRITNSFPLKYIIGPVRNLLHPRYNYYSRHYFYTQTKTEKKHRGLLVFNKPLYKPGDTVKVKAWIMTKTGKPVNGPLLVRLTDNVFTIDSIIATVQPYRAGGYEFSFVLNDSLDINLDEDYMITLEKSGSRKYDLDEYYGNKDDDEYALKRKVLVRGKFRKEEYELGAVTFSARADKDEHNRGNPLAVYLKATDENDMAVLDGRVELVVTTTNSASPDFYATHVFIPDTLWAHTQQLDAVGETKIVLPDSIFPAASFHYKIECTFLNSNNEYNTKTLQNYFDNDRYSILFEHRGDSLYIAQLNGTATTTAEAIISAMDGNYDEIFKQSVRLPATIPVNPYVSYYEAETDECYNDYEIKNTQNLVSCRMYRTKDSVFIQVENPRKIPFWYTIFYGNKPVYRGYNDTLYYAGKTYSPVNYFMSLQYVYGNEVYKEDYTIPFRDKLLTIQVNQPEYVYPGQTSTIDITVTGKNGKPVAGADVTAYAFTQKFAGVRQPSIPYLGKMYKNRKQKAGFYATEEKEMEGQIKLNWERWSKEIGLDSIEYFRFLHTRSIYINSEKTGSNITQIAPFVVIDGDLQPVHLIYIDEKPVFFSQAQQMERYSFRVSPGKHALRLRTHDRVISIDSIMAEEGKKTFICINGDEKIHKDIFIRKTASRLTKYEQSLWSRYMILLENNFGEQLAYVSQPGLVYLVNLPDRSYNYPYRILTGPLPGIHTNLVVKNKFTQPFEREGNYVFNITKGLIKQKQLLYGQYPFSSWLPYKAPDYNFKDYVLTETEIDSMWQQYLDNRSADKELFINPRINTYGNGRLHIGIDKDKNGENVFVKNSILFRYDDPDFARIYKGSSRNLGYVPPGMYRLFLLLKGDRYYIKDSLQVVENGINYYTTGTILPHERDSMSMQIADIIHKRQLNYRYQTGQNDIEDIKETFNEKYQDISHFNNTIYGRVRDAKTNEPIPGAAVIIKGTRIGVVTNADGFFQLGVPDKGALVFSFVGYETKEQRFSGNMDYDIKLQESVAQLSEVLVVGYSTARKKSITGSFIEILNNGYVTDSVKFGIRGSTNGVNISPLIIVDGLPFSGNLEDIDASLIADTKILKDAAATSIWGARAAGGVIIITTKNGYDNNTTEDPAPVPGNSLRKNFHDDAFWQPRLRTDAEGKASFSVTFPDDITNWRSFFIAMGSKKQSGFKETSIRSFKLVSGNIALPQFAIEGDTMHVIGKTLNYGPDSLQVKRDFSIDNNIVQENTVGVRNSFIDTFTVAVPVKDSLQVTYTVQTTDGYFDGEERTIPVFKRGAQETKGFFAALDTDTLIIIEPDPALGEIKLYAESSVLPVLLDEIEKLHRYQYLCNEQLASKLKALLLKKNVYGFLNKTFREESDIHTIIRNLNRAKTPGGLWGWWNNNDPTPWISLHVTEALLKAEKEGYRVNLSRQPMKDYLIFLLENYRQEDRITALRLLQMLDVKTGFEKYIDSLEAHKHSLSLYETLRLQEVKQELGMETGLDSLLKKQQHTLFGNIYWGEENTRFFNNSIQNTVLMYRLLKNEGGHAAILNKIRNYFLEKRKDGQWRNTYESSLILETILPDLLQKDSAMNPASVSINGGNPIRTFPFSTSLQPGENISISKQGRLPVYFTAYQQNHNETPKKVSGDFSVTSEFENNGQTVTALKAGEPVTMKVKVTVKADADYIMIEAPIPAGCSYYDKRPSYNNNEVHREYFKNKVSVFCRSLEKGEYTFTVSLLPRYAGVYNLNPAKAEMMYFPVFYGREETKKINIQ